jgi:hypothetical protein
MKKPLFLTSQFARSGMMTALAPAIVQHLANHRAPGCDLTEP